MSGYMPMPWTQGSGARADCVWLDGHREPVVGMGDESTWIDCNTPANARLVAAAPRLLQALQSIVASLAEHDDEGMIEHAEQMIAARTAIAAATGEQV